MGKPYRGRAIINNKFDTLEIIIPSRKNWFGMIFLCLWLCGWCFGEVFGLIAVGSVFSSGGGGLFMLVWCSIWTIGGITAIRVVIWQMLGKEIITAGNGQLTIRKKYDILSRPKTYDLNEVKDMRAQEDEPAYGQKSRRQEWGRRRNILTLPMGGNIRFDYGMKTIEFAILLDDAEAKYIVDKFREKKLIT